MSRSPHRPTRADVSRALAADVSGTEPTTDDVRRLAALAAAADRPGGVTRPWWRHGTVVGVLGVALTTGVGASYATGLVDAPWSPSERPVEHNPLLPELPSPSTERSPGAPSGSVTVDPEPDQKSTEPRSNRSGGATDEKGGRSSEAPGQTGAVPPETTPGEGTGNGRGHGPGGNPDHADGSNHGRPDDPGNNGQRSEQGNRPAGVGNNVRGARSHRV